MNKYWLTVCLLCSACGTPSPETVFLNDPIQEESSTPNWIRPPYRFESLADYTLHARVLSINTHHFGEVAELAPLDFVVGWRNMADPNVYKKLNIYQSGRWYMYKRDEHSPAISHTQIVYSSSNTHLIPKNKDVLKQLKSIRVDQVVVLKGHLVEITGPNGFHWRSSLSRTDQGAGRCELMWVESVEVAL